jgi:hypothetical protein
VYESAPTQAVWKWREPDDHGDGRRRCVDSDKKIK